MLDPAKDLIRVVHYPGSPLDLGIVVGFRTTAGKRAFNVLWHDGAGDVVDRLGRLDEMHDDERVVTVSRRREHCRRSRVESG